MAKRLFCIITMALALFALHSYRVGRMAETVAYAQGTANCGQNLSFPGASPGASVPTNTGSTAGCSGWRLTWQVSGFSSATIQLEGSQDGTTWAAFDASLVQEGSNPTNWTAATKTNTIVIRGYQPFVRVNVTAVAGTGSISTVLKGYYGTSANLDLGGGGGGATGPSGPAGPSGAGGATGATGPVGPSGAAAAAGLAVVNTTAVNATGNTSADQPLMDLAIPAGAMNTANTAYSLTGSGIMSVTATGIQFKIYACSVAACGSGSVVQIAQLTPGATLTNIARVWVISLQLATLSTGTSGSLLTHGALTIMGSSLAANASFTETNGGVSSAVDLTIPQFLHFSVVTLVAGGTNSITQQQAVISSRAGGGGAGSVSPVVPFTGWSIVNGAILSNFPTGAPSLAMSATDSVSLNWRLVTRPVSVPYSLILTMQCAVPLAISSVDCGAYISDGTQLIGIESLGQPGVTNGLRIERMDSVTSDNSTVAGPTLGVMNSSFWTVKIENDGTTRTFSYFSNGAFVAFYSEAAGSFLTETSIGFGGIAVDSGYPISNALLYWNGVP